VVSSFALAPPPVTVDGLLGVPIGIQQLTATLAFDAAARSATADATLDFVVGPTSGNGIFDLRQTITAAQLDGAALGPADVAHHDPGGGPGSKLRLIGTPLAAGSAHSLRLQYNYIDGYTDQRTAPFIGATNAGSLAGAAVTAGKEIGSFGTFDVTYRLNLESTGTTFSLSALNVFDKDPPFARLDFNYDPFTASPLGFTLKAAVSQKF